jgi:hypothetical protein
MTPVLQVFLNASGGFLAAYVQVCVCVSNPKPQTPNPNPFVQVFASHERWSTYLPNVVSKP